MVVDIDQDTNSENTILLNLAKNLLWQDI